MIARMLTKMTIQRRWMANEDWRHDVLSSRHSDAICIQQSCHLVN